MNTQICCWLLLLLSVVAATDNGLYFQVGQNGQGDMTFTVREWCTPIRCWNITKWTEVIITDDISRYCPYTNEQAGGCADFSRQKAVVKWDNTDNETWATVHHELLHHYRWWNHQDPTHSIEFWEEDCEIRIAMSVYPRTCIVK